MRAARMPNGLLGILVRGLLVFAARKVSTAAPNVVSHVEPVQQTACPPPSPCVAAANPAGVQAAKNKDTRGVFLGLDLSLRVSREEPLGVNKVQRTLKNTVNTFVPFFAMGSIYTSSGGGETLVRCPYAPRILRVARLRYLIMHTGQYQVGGEGVTGTHHTLRSGLNECTPLSTSAREIASPPIRGRRTSTGLRWQAAFTPTATSTA